MAINPNHLYTEELDYELRIRGCESSRKTVEQKRKILRGLYTKDQVRNIDIYDYSDDIIEIDDEKNIISTTIDSLNKHIIEFEGGSKNDSTYKKLASRLNYLTNRVKRFPSDNVENKTYKKEAYASCLELDVDLTAKVTPEPLNDTVESVPKVEPRNSNNISVSSYPLHKWNVKFDGSENLYSFLEEIEELSSSRNVSQLDLFNSAHELFSGSAKVWLRRVKPTVHSWEELVQLLKQFYLPTDPEEALWEQIKLRRQGNKEPVHVYIAVMDTYFSRLSEEPSETTKIKFIKRNLCEKYAEKLTLIKIDTISQLLSNCKLIDDDETARKHIPKSKSTFSLGPDLAYIDNSLPGSSCSSSTFSNNSKNNTSQKSGRPQTKSSNSISCWNCKGMGHSFTKCPSKRTKFCFKCGAPNYTVKNCIKCSKNVELK